ITLTPQEKPYFDDLWSKADSAQEGFLSRLDEAGFFQTTGLDDEDLGMAPDADKRGVLGRNGFNIALRLTGHRQAGKIITLSHLDLRKKDPIFDWRNRKMFFANAKYPHYPYAHSTAGPLPRFDQEPKSKRSKLCENWSEQNLQYCQTVFPTLSPQDGWVRGPIAKEHFLMTGLSAATLTHIWKLADNLNLGKLNLFGYTVAYYYVKLVLYGATRLPDSVPDEVLEACIQVTSAPPSQTSSSSTPLVSNNSFTPAAATDYGQTLGRTYQDAVAQATVELEVQQEQAQLNAEHDLVNQLKEVQTQQGKELEAQLQAHLEADTQREDELAKKVAAHKEAQDQKEQEYLQQLRAVQEQQQQALFVSLMNETQLYSGFGGGSAAQIAQAQQQQALTQQMYQNQTAQIMDAFQKQQAEAMMELHNLTVHAAKDVTYKPTGVTTSPPATDATSSGISAPSMPLPQSKSKPESQQPSTTAIDSNASKVTEPIAPAQPQPQQQQPQPPQPQPQPHPVQYPTDPQQYQPPPQPHQQQFLTDPKQYLTQPQTYSTDPRTYVTNPQTYSTDPRTYVTKPQTFLTDPRQYLNRPQPQPQYSTDPTQYAILPPQQQPQQDLLSTFTSVASKYLRPKLYAIDTTQYFAHQQQPYSTDNQYVVRPEAPMPPQSYHTQSPPPQQQQQYSTDPNQYVIRPQPLSLTHTQPQQYQHHSPPPLQQQQQQPYQPQPQMYQQQPAKYPNQPAYPPLQQQQQYFPPQSSYPSPHPSQPTSPNMNGPPLPYESIQQQWQQQQQQQQQQMQSPIYQYNKLPDAPVSVLNVQQLSSPVSSQGPPPSLPPRTSNPQTTQPSIISASSLILPRPAGPVSSVLFITAIIGQ
ncbi:hypothetical protein BGX26_004057, partial [Mortierella sp. AD094]